MTSNVTTAMADTTLKIYPPLEVPGPSPQVGINDPGFNKLTTAEKLNDGNYRRLVYESYPDEPTCACESPYKEFDVPKLPGNFLVCRSGCTDSCCSSMRQSGVASSRRDNANKDDKVAPLIPTYCVGNKRDKVRNVCYEGGRKAAYNGEYCCGNDRLRGGGEGGEERGERGMYPQSGKVNGTMVRWLDDARNGRRNDCIVESRLDGGGCLDFEYAERYPLNRSLASGAPCRNEENLGRVYPRANYSGEHPRDSNLNTSNVGHTTMNSRVFTTHSSYGPIAAGCCCPGKEPFARATEQRDNNYTRAMKPIPSVDCLVKAFRQTQEFVESLGKVPGFAGLGLMDPAESPYFGRVRRKESDLEGTRAAANISTFTNLPNPRCTGPCNAQILRSTVGGTGFQPIPPTISVPGQGGVVREAAPSMPGPGLTFAAAKSRKRDDKDKPKEADPTSIVLPVDIEAGPCGESLCKAKRRKDKVPEDSPQPAETDETAAKKIAMLATINGGRASRMSNKLKGINKLCSARRFSDTLGNGRKRSSVKSGRRTISFVYSAGDTYSDNTHGHKNCIEERHRVPGNMGWLWNLSETVGRLKPRPGWRPGAIGRHMSEILKQAKANFSHHKSRAKSSRSSSSRSRSAPSRGKRSKLQGDRGPIRRMQAKNKVEDKEEIEPPPTLHIHRKDGTYYVTMYPIKQDTMDVPKLEEPMKPLQFKIAKNKDDESVVSSSTASDMEIEFSPPAAVNRYRKKPNVVHVETQVKQQEIMDSFKIDDGLKARDKKKGKKSKK